MFIKETQTKRKDGTTVSYLQLVESYWDPKRRISKHRVIRSLGRKDQFDVDEFARLAESLNRYLGDDHGQSTGRKLDRVSSSRELGVIPLIHGLWQKLGIERFLLEALAERNFETPIERALFAMVAQRLSTPGSKLACEHWVNHLAYIPGLPQVQVHQLYRAMDFLMDHGLELEKELYHRFHEQLDLDLSVVFYDTTALYFEVDQLSEEGELRRRGHPKKDNPGQMPQVVVGLACNKQGIPIRHWVWPGNKSDVSTVQEVIKDLKELRPKRFFFVGDRGMISQANIDYLESRGLKYILGVKLRRNPISKKLLSAKGRYKEMDKDTSLKVRTFQEGDREVRYILSRNKQSAERDKKKREDILKYLEKELERPQAPEEGTKWSAHMTSHPVFGRFLSLQGSRLAVDPKKVQEEERLDGKYIVMTNDLELHAAILVEGYRELDAIEKVFEKMKGTLDARPIYHRLEKRIRSHINLCVLSYALLRTAELKTGMTWCQLERALAPLSAIELVFKEGTAIHRSDLGAEMREIFRKAGISPPARVLELN